jgi:hypothetical protein
VVFDVPGYICPHCGTDCSPIADGPCIHYFLTDGENGWRFTPTSRSLYEAAATKSSSLFRDLLYHDSDCRTYLIIRRAVYDDSLEMYVYSSNPEATEAAFRAAIERT